jgi:hypothetical protein
LDCGGSTPPSNTFHFLLDKAYHIGYDERMWIETAFALGGEWALAASPLVKGEASDKQYEWRCDLMSLSGQSALT